MKSFKIRVTGYGSEITIGHLDKETIDSVREKYYDGDSLESIIDDENVIDTHWSQIDDVYHNFNANEDFQLEVIDSSTNQVIHSISSEDLRFGEYDNLVECCEFEEIYSPLVNDEMVICCVTGEKGTLFEGEVEDEIFDLEKLKIKFILDVLIRDYYHGNMIDKIMYNGEEISNDGCDTDGKSFSVYMNL